MLPTQPQSIISILFNSIKAYKKVFLLVIPLTTTMVMLQLALLRMSSFSEQPPAWLGGVMMLLHLLAILCSCWATCLIYDILSKGQANYLTSLSLALKRFLKLFVLFLLLGLVLLGLGYLSFIFNRGSFFTPHNFISIIFLCLIVILLVDITFVFSTIYILDILVKDFKILLALKRAANIAFNIKNLWRSLGFLCYFFLIGLLLFVLIWILALFGFEKVPMLNNIIAALAMWFLLPLNLTILINFYHDLTLRFEGHD